MKNSILLKKIYCIALALFFAFAAVLGVLIGMPKKKVSAESNAVPDDMKDQASFLSGLYQSLPINGVDVPCYVLPSIQMIERTEVSQSGTTYTGAATSYSSLQIAIGLDKSTFLPSGNVYLISNSFTDNIFHLSSGVGQQIYICGLNLAYNQANSKQHITTGTDPHSSPYVTDLCDFVIYENSRYKLSNSYAINFNVPGSGYNVNLMNYISLYRMNLRIYKDIYDFLSISGGQTNFLLNPLTYKVSLTSATLTGSSSIQISLQTESTQGQAPKPILDFQILQTSTKQIQFSVDNSFMRTFLLRTGTSSVVYEFVQKYFNDYGYVSGSYDDGYDMGFTAGKDQGYSNGYSVGYEAGVNAGKDYSFLSLMSSVVDAPVKAFTGLLDFNVLGFNMAGFVLSLLSVALLLKIIMVFKNGGG